MKPVGTNCCFHPSSALLLVTLVATSAGTAMLCVAMMSEHWEYVTWDKDKLASIEENVTRGHKLQWLLDGQVARVVLEPLKAADLAVGAELPDHLPALFFAPIRGGIWTYCIHLRAEPHHLPEHMGFPDAPCANFLRLRALLEGSKPDWQHRMRNLSIACALVCLIILASSALVGAFGVTTRQISAISLAGVMYLLAGIFATFSLTIINFKRTKSKLDCLNASTSYGYAGDGLIVSTAALEKAYSLSRVKEYFAARTFSTGYSLQLGWGGIATCVAVSIFWISLSKVMRCNPMSTSVMIL